MKSSRWNAFAAVLLVAFVAVFALVAQWAQPTSERLAQSARSADPSGRLALFLLLEELGFAAEAWSDTPANLPRGEHVVWLAGSPERWLAGDDSAEESEPLENEPVKSGLGRHAFDHYRRFVEEGGTLILPWDSGARAFLTDELALVEFASLASAEHADGTVLSVRTSSGDTCDVEGELLPWFDGLDPNSALLPVWIVESADGREEVAAMSLPLGSGSVVVLGGDAWLDNDELGAHDHAQLAVHLVRELDRGGRILFDEYALGAWTPPTAIGLATSSTLLPFTLHLVLLFALFVWRSAWVGPFAREPEAFVEVSALTRARVLARLFERAGRSATLARMLRGGVVRAITRARVDRSASARVGAPPNRVASAPSAPGRGASTRAAQPDAASAEETELWIGALAARSAPDLDLWREVLTRRSVGDPAELERLARDLERLETRWKEIHSARIPRP